MTSYVAVVVTVSWCSVAFLSPQLWTFPLKRWWEVSPPPLPLGEALKVTKPTSLSLSLSLCLKAERKGNVFLEDYMHDNDKHVFHQL